MRFAHLAALGSSAILVSLAMTGCGDSAPVPQKGGYSVEFEKTGISCPIQSHNGDVGSGNTTLSTSNPDSVATDGTDDATITCSVSGTSTFTVDALATAKGNVLHVHVDSISTKNTTSNPAKGSASFASPETSGTSYSNPANKPCKFWFEDNTKETISSGRIWASFECDEVDSGMSACGLSSGVIVFYNCDTTAAPQ
jgi:hypothetical protein